MRRFIERRLNQSYIRKVAILVLAIFFIVLTVSFATAKRGKTVFGPFLGADFGAFYVAGQSYNQYGPATIYDVNLHRRLYKEDFPDAPANEELTYTNTPFFVAPFILLSRLPYAWAYFIWLVFSLSLYIAGFSILWRSLQSLPQEIKLTALLLALSFWPFLVECLAGGQTSAVAFFCLAVAIALEPRSRFWSGVVLAVCAYKPTLLILVVPMLLISGRWLTLVGLAAGNVVLALVSLALVGVEGCINFLNRLLFFSSAATGTETLLRYWKYADINAFFRLLLPHGTLVKWAVLAVFLLVLPFLVSKWWRLRGEPQRRLLWALTLTWTPVLNLYMGIYDTTILVLAALLLTAEFYSAGYRSGTLPFTYRCFLLALYLSPWFTQNIALMTRVQIYTLVIAAFGIYQLLREGARLGWQSQPRLTEGVPGCVDVEQGNLQAGFGRHGT